MLFDALLLESVFVFSLPSALSRGFVTEAFEVELAQKFSTQVATFCRSRSSDRLATLTANSAKSLVSGNSEGGDPCRNVLAAR